ncbi:MAG: HIT family protein [Gammaproteobacteria bacterium]
MSNPILKQMDACPFCKLDPNRVITESKTVVALFDGFPVSPGHALVVPRRHVASWSEATEAEKTAIWNEIDVVRNILDRRHHPDAFNIGLNDGVAAGQTVMHVHVHIIPRYGGDVDDPRGGIRWVVPNKATYWETGR